ncbi:unnamed protein product [Adineta steineri]|uniref:Uncharacterized protein n=1 Tax=Adineta steineri TaxID=433720 RepID=A0A818MUA8_9BILA|nr:unnamed protein product [Adineta steineri]CAF0879846.1 unnamed protein product [Adineta steineri]CAF0944072.1 unnamed protein product [Adineta steineri]CAF3513142.1 unnamed protein product [Adineta steineri]CAF3594594.1 unnamed protein product [Adineta steineri]
MPLGIYLDTPQGHKPATLPTHFTLHDFRKLIEKKVGNPEHYDYSLGDVIFRTWNEEAFNRQRSAIHDGITLIVQYPPVIWDKSSSEDGPIWRQATPGLCLDGFCLNIKCLAFEHKVIMNQGIGQFNIITNSTIINSQCPLCHTNIQPTTCAFNQCLWRLTGVKKQDNSNTTSPSSITTEWQDSKHEYHRWTDHFTSWSQLTIETKN